MAESAQYRSMEFVDLNTPLDGVVVLGRDSSGERAWHFQDEASASASASAFAKLLCRETGKAALVCQPIGVVRPLDEPVEYVRKEKQISRRKN